MLGLEGTAFIVRIWTAWIGVAMPIEIGTQLHPEMSTEYPAGHCGLLRQLPTAPTEGLIELIESW